MTKRPAYDFPILRVAKFGDGDTFDADLDLGFHLTARMRLRVLGLKAREDNAGKPEAAYAREWLTIHAPWLRAITLELLPAIPTPDGSFGRWLADVYDHETGERLADYVIGRMAAQGVDVRWPE